MDFHGDGRRVGGGSRKRRGGVAGGRFRRVQRDRRRGRIDDERDRSTDPFRIARNRALLDSDGGEDVFPGLERFLRRFGGPAAAGAVRFRFGDGRGAGFFSFVDLDRDRFFFVGGGPGKGGGDVVRGRAGLGQRHRRRLRVHGEGDRRALPFRVAQRARLLGYGGVLSIAQRRRDRHRSPVPARD